MRVAVIYCIVHNEKRKKTLFQMRQTSLNM